MFFQTQEGDDLVSIVFSRTVRKHVRRETFVIVLKEKVYCHLKVYYFLQDEINERTSE
jgi:hypothetical protein